MNERIEAYLDDLTRHLAGRTPDVRRVVAEVEAHLYDALDDGLDADEAIARVGAPRDIARRYRATTWRELVTALVFLGAVGLLAIGVSGVLSAGMRTAWGDHFLAGDYDGITYTTARCAQFELLQPHAATCEAAAAAHHADEVVEYRVAAGVLGALALGAWLFLRRRAGALPRGIVAGTGTAMFGLAAAGLLLEAFNQLEGGAGQWLSAALVSIVVAAAFGHALVRELSPA